jgi:hypothetical protein
VEAATSLTQGERARIITQPQPVPIVYRIISDKAIQIDTAGNPDGVGGKPGTGNGVILAKVVIIKPIFMIKSAAGLAIRVVGEITLDDGAEGGVALADGVMVLIVFIIRKRGNGAEALMAVLIKVHTRDLAVTEIV